MDKFNEAKKIIAECSEVERRAIYYWLAESYGEPLNGISKKERIIGGNRACVGVTNFPIFRIENLSRNDWSEEDFFNAYPQLTKEDLINAKAYAVIHKEEINREIQEYERRED